MVDGFYGPSNHSSNISLLYVKQPEIYTRNNLNYDGITLCQIYVVINCLCVNIFKIGICFSVYMMDKYQDPPQERYLIIL